METHFSLTTNEHAIIRCKLNPPAVGETLSYQPISSFDSPSVFDNFQTVITNRHGEAWFLLSQTELSNGFLLIENEHAATSFPIIRTGSAYKKNPNIVHMDIPFLPNFAKRRSYNVSPKSSLQTMLNKYPASPMSSFSIEKVEFSTDKAKVVTLVVFLLWFLSRIYGYCYEAFFINCDRITRFLKRIYYLKVWKYICFHATGNFFKGTGEEKIINECVDQKHKDSTACEEKVHAWQDPAETNHGIDSDKSSFRSAIITGSLALPSPQYCETADSSFQGTDGIEFLEKATPSDNEKYRRINSNLFCCSEEVCVVIWTSSKKRKRDLFSDNFGSKRTPSKVLRYDISSQKPEDGESEKVVFRQKSCSTSQLALENECPKHAVPHEYNLRPRNGSPQPNIINDMYGDFHSLMMRVVQGDQIDVSLTNVQCSNFNPFIAAAITIQKRANRSQIGE